MNDSFMNDMLETIEADDFEKPAWLFGTVILENREVAEKACRGLAIYTAITDEVPFFESDNSPYETAISFEESLAISAWTDKHFRTSSDVMNEVCECFAKSGFEIDGNTRKQIRLAVDSKRFLIKNFNERLNILKRTGYCAKLPEMIEAV